MTKSLLVRFVALAVAIAVGLLAFRWQNQIPFAGSPNGNKFAVNNDDLAKLIDRADRVVVLRELQGGSAVLYESAERKDLNGLKYAVRVKPPEEFHHCMCDGTPVIFLYAKGEKIGQLTNHHGKLLRCSLWKSDAPLADSEAFLKWFDDRGVPGPRKEFNESLEREREWQRNENKWVAGMPECLRPLWPVQMGMWGRRFGPLQRALTDQFPLKEDRILALFSWYGCGAGPWSGFPAYEDVPEILLLDYPTADLLAAVAGRELNPAQTEGVARLFGGWKFPQQRPGERDLLPDDLRAKLLSHSLASADEDKRNRARWVFDVE